MLEGLAEAIKVAVQWLFAPLLAVAVLAWLCLRIEASGTFDAIRDSVRKMSAFQRFAAAAFLAVFIVFASEKTNSPPADLPPAVLPSVPPQPPEPPRSGASDVTNLCFTGISVSSNHVALSLACPTNFIPAGSIIDIFVSTSLVSNAWNWIAGFSVGSGATNWTPTVDTSCLAVGTENYPPTLFFSSAVRADPGDLRDTDGDTIPDAYEVHNGTNPYVPDYIDAHKLTVGPSGLYADISSALAASTAYSIIELDAMKMHVVGYMGVRMPQHPVMICAPPGPPAIVRTTSLSAFLLDSGTTSQTLFRNLYVLLDATSGFQAGFWVGGNLPWYPIAASATFEDIYVRAPKPGVEHFGWLLYTSAEEPVSLSRCTVNAAGSEWVYGVQDFGTAPLLLEDCTFVNFPSNLTGRSCGILTRSSSNAGGGAEVSVSRTVFDKSFTNAIMIGRLGEGVSNVMAVANCIVPRELSPDFPLEFVSGVVVTNAALSWAGFPWTDSPSVALGMGALLPVANEPAVDTDGDGVCDYVEVYEKGTDPYLVDSDLDGISDYDEDQQGTDPTNPHSFIQNLTVTVTNSAASFSTYVAWGRYDAGWETNGLTMFQSSSGTVVYTNAPALGATHIKAFCDIDGDGEYSDETDILMIQAIPQQSMATCIFNFASVDSDGDGVSDVQEHADWTNPHDANNFHFRATYKYTDRDAWHGCTNLIAISETSNGWNTAEIVAASIQEYSQAIPVNRTVTGGVIYVKCLHDRNGNRELDPETEKVYVTAFRALQNGKTVMAYIGDADDDGVNDTQELADCTDIFDAKNYRLKARMDFINLDWPGTVTNYVTVSESTDDWNFSMVVTSFVGHAAGFALNMVLTNGVAYMRCLQDIEADHEYNAMTDLLYRATLTEKNTRGRFALTIGDYDGDSIPDSIEKAEETDWRNGQSYCFSLNATVVGVFAPSNALTAIAYLGSEANVLYGPCIQSGSTLTVNFGHQSTDSRETVSFMFWDDRNANGIRDLDEPRATCDFRVTGHEMCTTNHLELGDFDADDDGMLDAWELQNGLSPSNAADALQDADGDGFLNLYEYVAGTDPNDADDNGEGTALYAATHGVDDRIATANYSGSKSYYLNYQPQGHGVTGELQNICFDLNPNCWLHGVDMSCLSVYDDGLRDAWRHPLTAITPRHVISARHVAPADGTRVTFQSPSGEVVVRTLIAQTLVPRVADSDLWVGLLDSPLPSCIKIAKLLPQNYRLYVGEGRKLPLVRISREKECNLHDIIYLAPTDRHQRMCCLEYSTNALRYRYMRPPWSMDSGHPLFLLFGGELVFVCPAKGYYGDNQGTGYLCAYYKALIQRAIDGLSEPFGIPSMQMEEFDLSVY